MADRYITKFSNMRGWYRERINDVNIVMPTVGTNTALPNITISETALIAISAGVRKVTVPCVGATLGGNYLAFATAATPTGYALHDVICSTVDTLTVSLTAPLLAIGQSYSITCRIMKIA